MNIKRWGWLLVAPLISNNTYYITWPGQDKPIISYGTDRLEALVYSGVTVWTEAEWSHSRTHGEFKPCACDDPALNTKQLQYKGCLCRE